MLRLEHLHKSFGTLVAVDDLTLEVARGEVFGLLGPNGAGKTTTINMAVGLLTPDRGHVHIAGLGSPTQPAVRRIIGVATQALALYDDLTAEENVRFFGQLQGLRGTELAGRVRWALKFAQLWDRRGDSVKKYSGGMQRRLNLAVALVHDPQLLLLDEPTVGVDPQSRNALFERIQELRRLGRTVVLTTHYIEEAERLCDRVGIIDHGKLLVLDSVAELIRVHGGQTVVVAETDHREVRVERPNLEAVFLNLTGRNLRD